MIDVVIDLSDIYGLSSEAKAIQEQTAFDSQSSSLIKLNNNTILYLKEVNKFLALVCILREENFIRQGLFARLLLTTFLSLVYSQASLTTTFSSSAKGFRKCSSFEWKRRWKLKTKTIRFRHLLSPRDLISTLETLTTSMKLKSKISMLNLFSTRRNARAFFSRYNAD